MDLDYNQNNDKREWCEYIVLFFACLMVAFMLTCCTTIEYVPVEKEVIKSITITERDTLIKVKKDQATLQALLSCDSLNNVLVEQIKSTAGNRTNIDMSVNADSGGTQLFIDCNTDSLELEIILRDKLIEELQNNKEVIVAPAELSYYQQTMMRLGWCFVIICIGYILWKFIKWYIKSKCI